MEHHQYKRDQITKWVKQEKDYLYKLGFIFLVEENKIEHHIFSTINQLGECFERLDNKYKEKFISMFIQLCMSETITENEAEFSNEILHKLFKIELSIRQCLFLKYVLHMNEEEISKQLNLEEIDVAEKVVNGLQKLISYHESAANLHLQSLVNYHEGKLSLDQYKHVNQHISENENVHNDLEKLINVIHELDQISRELKPSPHFLEPNKPLTEAQIKSKKRKQQMMMTALSTLLIFGIIISSFGVNDLGRKWKVWTGEAAHFGEKVFISATDQNIEITVTHVAADDLQTVLYYEIRDYDDEFHYSFEFHNDFFEIKEKDIWEEGHHAFHSAPRPFSRVVSEEIFSKGRLLLPPIKNDEEMITVQFNTVEQIEKGTNIWDFNAYNYRNQVQGEWILEVPITKYEPKFFEIEELITVEGQDIRFIELEVRPTVTYLKYEMKPNEDTKVQQSHQLYFSSLSADGQHFHPDFYLESWRHNQPLDRWVQIYSFESIYYQVPNNIAVELDRMHTYYDYQLELKIDYENLPMEFEFLDSTITVADVKLANPIKIVIEEEIDPNRGYDSFHFDFHYDYYRLSGGGMNYGWGMSSEGIYIDKEGNQYSDYDDIIKAENPFNIRYLTTKQIIEIHLNDEEMDSIEVDMFPTNFMINGYQKSYPINERININLN